MSKKTTNVPYRRKREGKTDYKKRLALLKSGSHRLVVRKSVDNISAQIVEYHPDGDKVIASAHSRELIGKGWKLSRKSVPAAYLTGLLLGKKAKEDGEIIADFGMHPSTPGSRLYAVVKGALDAGIKVKVSRYPH
jgi:large subunit ribosomal protein L18